MEESETTMGVSNNDAGDHLLLPNVLPRQVHEGFLEGLLVLEEGSTVSLAERLDEAGIRLPPVEDLDPGEVSDKLWEVIHGLARLKVYLMHTDHLSDRELYEHLLEDLREPDMPVPEGLRGCGVFDFTSSGAPEEMEVFLACYADSRFRRLWREEFPHEPLPERRDPPFDRDRHLPRPEWEDRHR